MCVFENFTAKKWLVSTNLSHGLVAMQSTQLIEASANKLDAGIFIEDLRNKRFTNSGKETRFKRIFVNSPLSSCTPTHSFFFSILAF